MSEQETAKLFNHEGGQAVQLPEAVEFPGDRVRVRRVGAGVLLEPISGTTKSKYATAAEWYAALDEFAHVPFMENGRNQPPMPPAEDLFD